MMDVSAIFSPGAMCTIEPCGGVKADRGSQPCGIFTWYPEYVGGGRGRRETRILRNLKRYRLKGYEGSESRPLHSV